MAHKRQQLGKKGEDIAAQFLIEQGIQIIDRNFHFSRYAEIDLIGMENGEVVFIEVKTRNNNYSQPEEAVTPAKQDKIRQAAESYILAHPQLGENFRIDVVAVNIIDVNDPQIKHWRNI